MGSFVQEAQRRIAEEVELPPGYFIEWGGEFENLERALNRLIVVVPVALILNLCSALHGPGVRSVIAPDLPQCPACFVGWDPGSPSASDETSAFPLQWGSLPLFGVAVLNGVVLVSHMKQTLLKEKGADLDSVAVRSAHTRLRPVLMTATVASLGFIPMAPLAGNGSGSSASPGNGCNRWTDNIYVTDSARHTGSFQVVCWRADKEPPRLNEAEISGPGAVASLSNPQSAPPRRA